MHLTVDYPVDLERFRRMLGALEEDQKPVSLLRAARWMRAHLRDDVAHARDADYTAKRARYLKEER